MMFAYRPRAALVAALYAFFTAETPGGIPSNFPALARKLEALQNGIEPEMVYSAEAPQERDIDVRVLARKVQRALEKLAPYHQDVLLAAYTSKDHNVLLEEALSSRLVGLAAYSEISEGHPEKHLNDQVVMRVIRSELEGIWREAHVAFEKAFKSC